jgi:hypothetical protein
MTVKWLAKEARVNKLPACLNATKDLASAIVSASSCLSSAEDLCLFCTSDWGVGETPVVLQATLQQHLAQYWNSYKAQTDVFASPTNQ